MSRIQELKRKFKAKEKILLDSGMGTELERVGMSTQLPLWSAKSLIDNPRLIQKIHEDNILAGSQIITTNTFRTNRRTLKKANLEGLEKELTLKACEIAKKACESQNRNHVLIAGSMTTIEDCYRPDLVPQDNDLIDEHYEQARFLKEGGVDFILIETINTIREGVIALKMAKKTGLETAISFLCNSEGDLVSGDRLEDAYLEFLPLNPLFISVNCALPRDLDFAVYKLLKISNFPIGVYANSNGHAKANLGWKTEGADDLTAFLKYAEKWLSSGVSIIGGCCGTNYEYIQGLNKIIRKR